MLSRKSRNILRQCFPLSCLCLLACWVAQPSRVQSSGKTFEPDITTGALNLAREGHTATLLQNGKVLVAGGRNGTVIFNSAELYDPTTGTWSAAPNFSTARFGHSAVLLRTGQVLLIGGQGNGVLDSAELYDPADNSWKPTLSSKLNSARFRFTATLLNTGRVLVSGGQNASGYLRSAELYDQVTRVWAPLPNTSEARAEHTATLLNDGQVLVTGGFNGTASVKTAELFDPNTNRWRRTGDLATPRRQHTATRLADGTVLVAGGANGTAGLNSVEIYNPLRNTWAATGALNIGRRGHTANLLPNGSVLVVGGVEPGGKTLDSAESYDLVKRGWASATQGPPFTSQTFVLVDGRSEQTATLLPNGKVLFAGGLSTSNTTLKSTELYEYALGKWEVTRNSANSTTQMFSERALHTATLLPNGKVLVAGGLAVAATAQVALSTAELFDPSNGTWTTTGALGSARFNHTATLLPNGRVLVVGGQAGQTVLDGAELYDPVTGVWTKAPTPGVARHSHTATLLRTGQVLIAGGSGSNLQPLRSAQLYDPANGTTGSWSNSQDLPQARSHHSATLLPDGVVFVFGGKALDSQLLNNAALFSTATGWTTRNFNNPPNYRWAHVATLLPNNRVLISGGQGGKTQTDVNTSLPESEIYNHNAGAFEANRPVTGSRIKHTATLLPNGKVLLAGGRSIGAVGSNDCPNPRALPPAVLFDPSVPVGSVTSVVQAANPLQMRNSQTATLLPDGDVLLAGGLSEEVRPNCAALTLKHSEVFDVGLAYLEEWRPALAFIASTPNTNSLVGVQFQGVSEAGGDGGASSASNYPLVQLLSLSNEQVLFITPTNWTNNTFNVNPAGNFAPGLALLTVSTNGIPSRARIVTSNGGNFVTPNGMLLGSISGRVIYHNIAIPVASISLAPVSGSPRECNTQRTVRISPNGEFSFRDLVATPDQGRNFCRYQVTPAADRIQFFPASAIFTMTTTGSGGSSEVEQRESFAAEQAQSGLTCLNCINNVFVSNGPFWNLSGNVQRTTGTGVSDVVLEFSVPYETFDDRLTCEDASGNAVPCSGGARTINGDVCAKVSTNPLITDATFKCACTTLRSDGVCEKTVLARYSMPTAGAFNVANVPNGANAVVTPFNLPAGTQYSYAVQPLAPPGAATESFIRLDQVEQNYDNLLITANSNGCTFNLSTTAISVPRGGGASSLNVSTTGGSGGGSGQCAWSAVSNSSWLAITSGGAGTGNGSVGFAAAANTNAAARAGTLTIAGLTFTVTQPGTSETPAVINVSAASFFADRQAPESIISAFGAKLATAAASATTLPLPLTLNGTSVSVRDALGVTRAAQLFFVSLNQVNFLLPPDTAQGTATATITTGDGVVSAGQLQVERVAPGVFSANANGAGVPAAVLLRVAANGVQSYEPVSRFDTATSRYVPQPVNLGPTGEQVYLILFGTGLRRRTSLASVTGAVDGLSTPVGFAQAQGSLIGTDQINLGPLPRALAGRGNVNVMLNVEGRSTNVLVVAIQ